MIETRVIGPAMGDGGGHSLEDRQIERCAAGTPRGSCDSAHLKNPRYPDPDASGRECMTDAGIAQDEVPRDARQTHIDKNVEAKDYPHASAEFRGDIASEPILS